MCLYIIHYCNTNNISTFLVTEGFTSDETRRFKSTPYTTVAGMKRSLKTELCYLRAEARFISTTFGLV